MARPLLLLELVKGCDFSDPKVVEALSAGLAAANAVQPGYSRVLKHHVLFAEQGSLPRTVKGTVQRGKAEALFAAELQAVKSGVPPSVPTLVAEPDEAAEAYDSLSLSSAASKPGGASSALDHLTGVRTLGSLWIILAHFAVRRCIHRDMTVASP